MFFPFFIGNIINFIHPKVAAFISLQLVSLWCLWMQMQCRQCPLKSVLNTSVCFAVSMAFKKIEIKMGRAAYITWCNPQLCPNLGIASEGKTQTFAFRISQLTFHLFLKQTAPWGSWGNWKAWVFYNHLIGRTCLKNGPIPCAVPSARLIRALTSYLQFSEISTTGNMNFW